MRPRRIRKLLSIALGLIVLGSLWYYLAPPALGGSTTYVVTSGISMEPRFHSGDLAIVRSESSYHVGEIVAYHNRLLKRIVLHRIIGRTGSGYIFKGDNNNFVDTEDPTASQLIGALWVHIPGAGARLQSIRSPALMGALLFFGVLLLTGGVFAQRRRRRGRQRRAGESVAHPPTRQPRRPAEPVVAVVGIGLLALLPFLLLALLAFTRAPSARRPFNIPYKQSGTLSYSADAAPGPAYPSGRAVTGEPLFTHVLSAVDLRFGYLFHSEAGHALTGRSQLAATISSTTGWQHTLTLGPPTYFRGDHALITGTLDLSSLLALVHSLEATTKVAGSYTLAIIPRVSANGSLNGMPLHTTFSPEIRFALGEDLVKAAAPSGGSLGAEKPSKDPLAPSKSGSVTGSRFEPLFLSLVFVRMSVASARTISLSAIAIILGAVLAMLALIRPMLAFVRPPRRDESESIRARYGHLIVPVARVSQLPGVAVIDVADMEALARIAEHYDRSILHEVTADGHAFWVADESGQFRYTLDTHAPSADNERSAPAWITEQESVASTWSESPTAELAIAPTWTEDGTAEPAIAPTWTESDTAEPTVAPTWTEDELAAPSWTAQGEILDLSTYDLLTSQVYADELALGGVFSASETQPATPESVVPEPATPEAWQEHDEPDTFAQEAGAAPAPSESGVSRTRSGAVFVRVTGF